MNHDTLQQDAPSLTLALRYLAAAGPAQTPREPAGISPHPSFETLVAYAAGELAPADETLVREHLAGCDTCPHLLLDLDAYYRGQSLVIGSEGERQQEATTSRYAAPAAQPTAAPRLDRGGAPPPPKAAPWRAAGPAAPERWSRGARAAVAVISVLLCAAGLSAVANRLPQRWPAPPATNVGLAHLEQPRGPEPLTVTMADRTLLVFDDLAITPQAHYDLAIYATPPGGPEHRAWAGQAAPPVAKPFTLELTSSFLPPGQYRVEIADRAKPDQVYKLPIALQAANPMQPGRPGPA